MRQDQYEKLQQLEEQLTDAFIGEAVPEKWPGAGMDPGAMDQKTRGDRYWCKKNAVATLSLVQRVGTLIGVVQLRGAGTTPPAAEGAEGQPDHLDDEIASAEKEAKQLMRELQSGVGKAAFDKRVHGRAPG
jgi:hypothetical protein